MDHIGGSRRTRPGMLIGGLLLAIVVLAGACKSSSTGSSSGTTEPAPANGTNITVPDPGPPQAGGTLKVGLNAETDGWSPIKNQWAGSAYIVSGAVFDRIAAYDVNAVAQPYLAESLTPNADFTTWDIKMRPGVKFHDGTPCDAAALKTDFDAQLGSLLTGPVFSTVTSIEVKDELTVRFTMSQPWSTFPDTMATQVGSIAAPAMVNAPDGGVRAPIGTGPFIFESWEPNSKLVVKKNPDYWQSGYPLLDGIDFKVLPEYTSRSAALTTGDVDMIEMGDPGQIISLTEQANAGKLQLYTDQGLQQNETFSALNVAAPPFDDPLARQIIAYGTDRDTLSQSVFKGIFPPALGPFSEAEPYYSPTDMPTFDPEKAKELEAQYEEKYGKPLEFNYLITPQPEVQSQAAAGQQQLKDIGVKMNIKSEDQATLIGDVVLGNYQATGFILFGTNTLDVNYVFIASSTVRPPGQLSLNFTRNDDPILTKALDDARTTADRTEQIAQYKIVQQQMAKDLNFIFLVHNVEAIAYSNSTHGLVDQTLPDGSAKQITIVPTLQAAWKS